MFKLKVKYIMRPLNLKVMIFLFKIMGKKLKLLVR